MGAKSHPGKAALVLIGELILAGLGVPLEILIIAALPVALWAFPQLRRTFSAHAGWATALLLLAVIAIVGTGQLYRRSRPDPVITGLGEIRDDVHELQQLTREVVALRKSLTADLKTLQQAVQNPPTSEPVQAVGNTNERSHTERTAAAVAELTDMKKQLEDARRDVERLQRLVSSRDCRIVEDMLAGSSEAAPAVYCRSSPGGPYVLVSPQ